MGVTGLQGSRHVDNSSCTRQILHMQIWERLLTLSGKDEAKPIPGLATVK